MVEPPNPVHLLVEAASCNTRCTAYRRIRTFLREYQRPKIFSPVNWRYFLAFLRANVRLGVFGRERFEYWRLLIWTSFHRPTLFPLAVTLSVFGHHFRKTCRVLGL